MSHITTVESAIKIVSEQHLTNALSALCTEYEGMRIERSQDGRIIQVKYAELDNPVRNYHPEGNLRFTLNSEGEWEMSGDAWNCRPLYTEVTDAVLTNYQTSGVEEWAATNGYAVEASEVGAKKEKIMIVRKW